jgi:DNA-binding NtrC family response regulator
VTAAAAPAAPPPPRPVLDLDRLLGFPALAAALDGAARAAATEAPVLLLGEPGSGRTTVARALHRASPRAGGPLVEVDPGAVPASLFESELFGHRAGAFTGAAAASPGRVGRAAGGTLLLDHVEELPLAVQPKLLRLLAERRYAPLGDAERAADVRFLAAGPPDLARRVERGAFRPDLFYRLEVVAFRLPPLRERRGELEAIATVLLDDLGERFGRRARLAPSAFAWMRRHAWPGNLTELRHLLERELILTDAGELAPDPPASLTGERPRPLAEVEIEEIRRALAYTRGHQGEAAALLGISRKALWAKRKRFGIH